MKKLAGLLLVALTGNAQTLLLQNYDSRAYNFTAQRPGGSLIVGSNTITLSPLVKGLAIGRPLYVSGGTGTADNCSITAVGSNTVTMTCAHTHSGAWTVQSASGGIQEAICAMPTVGGIVVVASSVTPLADVTACGKTSVTVQRQAGATISGSFTILGAPPASANSETYVSQPDYASLATVADGMRVVRGNFPVTAEFGSNTVGTVSAITGAIDFPTTGTGGGAAVAGYARTGSVNANAVGLFGVGGITATTIGSGAWGMNTIVTNCATTSLCTAGFSGINLYSGELDTNLIALAGGGTPVGNVVGLSITGGSTIQPTGTAAGIEIRQMGIFDNIGWKDGIYLDDGAATVSGINIGTAGTGNNVDSMHLIFRARNSGGTNMQAAIFADALGDLDLLPATNSWIVLNDGSLNPALIVKPSGSTPTVTISHALINATVAFASLGAVPATGTAVYCTNCTTASTCAGSGTGHLAVSNGTNWTCQ